MPPKMNHLWKTLQKKMSDKRTQQVTRPRKGGKGTALKRDRGAKAEPDNKQKKQVRIIEVRLQLNEIARKSYQ